MKISPWLRASVVFLLVGIAAAQKSNEAEVPVENEPHHHLVFENEYVRVFKVEVPPHQETLVHRHKRDYVVVTIGDATVTNAVVGKEPRKWNFKDGDVTFLEATGEKSFAHKAVNESDRPFRNFTIEMKHASKAEKKDGDTTILASDRFAVLRVTHGEEISCYSDQPCLGVYLSGPASFWKDGLLEKKTLEPGDVYWISNSRRTRPAFRTMIKGENFTGLEIEFATKLYGQNRNRDSVELAQRH
jgi:quercetin dioxygenase-like cupin family protein